MKGIRDLERYENWFKDRAGSKDTIKRSGNLVSILDVIIEALIYLVISILIISLFIDL